MVVQWCYNGVVFINAHGRRLDCLSRVYLSPATIVSKRAGIARIAPHLIDHMHVYVCICVHACVVCMYMRVCVCVRMCFTL
jgi:hypothetical protein